MSKIKSLVQMAKIVTAARKAGKRVGLITGCFDVIHAGHVDLFQFAKKRCEVVVVGLDSDETIKLNKGPDRPIHNISQRERVLAGLESVDGVFEIRQVLDWGKKQTNEYYVDLYKMIRPDYLVTSPLADRFWREKKVRAKAFGARLLCFKKRPTSTTLIAEKIAAEM